MNNNAELHIPCIIRTYDFIHNKNRYLIAKRSDNRELFPGKWEFGAAKPKEDESFVDAIKREYKEDFNITDIIFDIDMLGYISPLAIYEGKRIYDLYSKIEDQKEIIYKGIIFSGRLANDPNDIIVTNKHSEYKLLTSNEIFELQPWNCVPGLLDHIMMMEKSLK